MAEDWDAVQAEVSGALAEIELEILVHKKTDQEHPWGGVAAYAVGVPVSALDRGVKTRFNRAETGELVPRKVRVVTMQAGLIEPEVGDAVTIKGHTHTVRAAFQVAPSDTSLLYRLELEATANVNLT